VEPGQPGGFLHWLKTLLNLALGVQLVEALLFGPDQCVKRCSGHRTFPVSALFPTTLQFLPTPRSIPKRRLTGKEHTSRRDDLICSSGAADSGNDPQDFRCFLVIDLNVRHHFPILEYFMIKVHFSAEKM
jgi:hypothetical protein